MKPLFRSPKFNLFRVICCINESCRETFHEVPRGSNVPVNLKKNCKKANCFHGLFVHHKDLHSHSCEVSSLLDAEGTSSEPLAPVTKIESVWCRVRLSKQSTFTVGNHYCPQVWIIFINLAIFACNS